jgi:hypothetical protein
MCFLDFLVAGAAVVSAGADIVLAGAAGAAGAVPVCANAEVEAKRTSAKVSDFMIISKTKSDRLGSHLIF